MARTMTRSLNKSPAAVVLEPVAGQAVAAALVVVRAQVVAATPVVAMEPVVAVVAEAAQVPVQEQALCRRQSPSP